MSTVLAVLGQGVVDPAKPVINGEDLAVLRGISAFETILVSHDKPVLLDSHLERLGRSGQALDVAIPSAQDLRQLVEQAMAAFEGDEGALRITVTPGPEGGSGLTYALLSPISPLNPGIRENGIKAVTLSQGIPAGLRVAAPWLLGGVKSGSYAVTGAAEREAHRRGAQDAIWISSDGEVLEGTKSAIAWIRGGDLITVPAAEVGILPSVTWELVEIVAKSLHIPTCFRRARIDEVRAADEVVLLSSIRGIAPVVEIDGRTIGSGAPGAVTRQLQKGLDSWLEQQP